MQGGLTKYLAASGVVKAGNGRLISAVLAAGSDAATLIIQDDPDSADGDVLLKLSAVATGSASVVLPGECARLAGTGMYASLTGTSPVATIGYE